ncbi:MAG TPA: cytoplasmic protein [Thermoanaerobaculia bacterium]|nr:cytoplasmic protein [Thermoanaerobaculia bacterium]
MRRIGYLAIGAILGCVITAAVLHAQNASAPDAVKLTPQYYTVRVDNERVRVVDYHLKPGEREPMHSHLPGVAYVIGGAKLRNTFPDGTSAEGMLNPGDVHWREGNVVHAVENIGQTEAHAIIVELKAQHR